MLLGYNYHPPNKRQKRVPGVNSYRDKKDPNEYHHIGY